MCNRHLALAEAPDLHLILELVETGGEAFAKFALADDYLELTLETADGGLADLHNICLNRRLRGPASPRLRHNLPRPARRQWCGRRDSNPHDLRHRNLNPARLPVPPRPRALQRLSPAAALLRGGQIHASTLPPRGDGRAFRSACSRMGRNFKRTGVRSRRSYACGRPRAGQMIEGLNRLERYGQPSGRRPIPRPRARPTIGVAPASVGNGAILNGAAIEVGEGRVARQAAGRERGQSGRDLLIAGISRRNTAQAGSPRDLASPGTLSLAA